ncbi:MAG: hypothetical protein LBD03_08650 [Methanobrevibacter sp.]|jgi:hypothetical protein|nr:hypothetical protein [Candidatus Methanovirga procula]
MLIALVAVSCIGACSASDKFLIVYAKTQNNDGDGWLIFYDMDDNFMHEILIHKGETLKVNLKQFVGLNRVAFHSVNRLDDYNANLKDVSNYLYMPAWEDVTDFKVKVNFYKKEGYRNKYILPNGWQHGDEDHHYYVENTPVQNARFSWKYQIMF